MGRKGTESFEKRRKEKARLERQAAKRERRVAPKEEATDGPDETALMERFRVLSERHAAGKMSNAAYEMQRREIFEALGLDA
jgi:hypothetical protein